MNEAHLHLLINHVSLFAIVFWYSVFGDFDET